MPRWISCRSLSSDRIVVNVEEKINDKEDGGRNVVNAEIEVWLEGEDRIMLRLKDIDPDNLRSEFHVRWS